MLLVCIRKASDLLPGKDLVSVFFSSMLCILVCVSMKLSLFFILPPLLCYISD